MKKIFFGSLLILALAGNLAFAQNPCNDPDDPACPIQQTSSVVPAGKSISGDDLCGGGVTSCNASDFKALFERLLPPLIQVTMVFGVGAILYLLLMAKWKEANGNSAALAEARYKIGQAVIGFCMVIAVVTGVYIAMVEALGLKVEFLKLWKLFVMEDFIPHAYAQTQFENPLGSNNLFSLIVTIFNLFLKFFVYPGLVVFWVFAGFKFITSQGNPEGLKTARGWLWTTVIVTVVVFAAQAFLLAVQGTVTNLTS